MQRQLALAEEQRALQTAQREFDALLAARGRTWRWLGSYRSMATVPLAEVGLCEEYLRAASKRISRQTGFLDDARERVEEKRASLAGALKAEQIIRRLRERERARYLKEASRRERAWLDEVAGQGHLRVRRGPVGERGWSNRGND